MAVDDSTIQQAQQAAATPANDAPAPVAPAPAPAPVVDRQKQINADPAYWGGSDPKKTAALRDEMRRLVANPDAIIEEDRQKQEVAAKLTASEKAVAALRERPGFWNKDAADHAEIMVAYRKALAAGEEPHE